MCRFTYAAETTGRRPSSVLEGAKNRIPVMTVYGLGSLHSLARLLERFRRRISLRFQTLQLGYGASQLGERDIVVRSQ